MYALYYTSHLVLVSMLLLFGIMQVKRSLCLNSSKKTAPGRKPVKVLASILISIFCAITVVQYQYQADSDLKFAGLRSMYDKREWRAERFIKKGTIYDRSGLDERALAISIKDTNGRFKREYPLESASGHILGYSSRARGRAGLEAAFVSELIGNDAGSLGGWLDNLRQRLSKPEPAGSDIFLTIDSRIQAEAFEAFEGQRGAAVVMIPETGELLALVSAPGYSPIDAMNDSLWNAVVTDTTGTPLFNRALSGLYPPGSIFKIITAAAAIRINQTPEIKSGPDGFLPKNSSRAVHEHEFEEYTARGMKWTGHGRLDINTAFTKSSNVYFAKSGSEIGAAKMADNAYRAGFGMNIRWNSASSALKSWFPVKKSNFPDPEILNDEQLAWSSIGQYKVLVSPIHMAIATSAVANGGDLVEPFIEMGRFPKTSGKAFSGKTAAKLRKMMRNAVNGGTGYRANVPGLQVAGKTGTAENGKGKPHGWFTSFAPFDDPKIVVVVLVEHGGYGGVAAARIARTIYESAKKEGYFN